jgi:hypothetical protein
MLAAPLLMFISRVSAKKATMNKAATNANASIQHDRNDPGMLLEPPRVDELAGLWLPALAVSSTIREAISSSSI